ncbi:glycosyltransferase family 2 protein [Leptospira sp. 85282-16]|uniref:glycosyltransferase family 2 protein n=1 Tax=Leptospira sp. 85282-16 TaxID=2971256 RepID=UPI0021C16D5B|nr:glycosyltransferase family 2 protein [Leptospira sp. 85282-16]MCT8332225.1 glycosyltransferase family 2 protein [Leptospira sp. 85282-16]
MLAIDSDPSVGVVIVCFNPDLNEVENLLIKISNKNVFPVLVDNFSSNTDRVMLEKLAKKYSAKIIFLPENYGIAKAQNLGITECKKENFDFILFFDQDSDPDKSLILKLIEAYKKLSQDVKVKIGILGSRYNDPRQNNPPPFLRFVGLRMIRCNCKYEDSLVPVDYVIASGSMVSMPALNEIGDMREDLFIDYVDIEWGLRAKNKGFQNYGVCNALMNHSLGDKPRKFLNKNIPIHSPLRHYYHFRNAILLYKVDWIPLNWKLVDCYRLILKFVFYSIFTEKPLEHFKMMIRGIIHGIFGRSGKF